MSRAALVTLHFRHRYIPRSRVVSQDIGSMANDGTVKHSVESFVYEVIMHMNVNK